MAMREKVTLSFNGLMLERLVERATKNGVVFFEVKRITAREAILVTDGPGARKLIDMAGEFSLDVRRIRESGSGVVFKRAIARWPFFAAMAIVGAIAVAFLSRIWIIDIVMLDGKDSSGLYTALEEIGVMPGVYLDKGDMRVIESALRARSEDYSYVGARIQGIRLLIEAAEVFPAPDIYEYAKPKDIVSSADALIYSVDVLAGTPMVTAGQFVKKGDVLIKGIERDGRETNRPVNAMGSVIGRAWLRGEAQIDLSFEKTTRTGRKRVESELRLWDYSRKLKTVDNFDSEEIEEAFYPIAGIIAPLGVLKRSHYEVATSTVWRDIDQAKQEAATTALDNAMLDSPKGVSPFDKWADYVIIDNEKLRCRMVVEIRFDVASGET